MERTVPNRSSKNIAQENLASDLDSDQRVENIDKSEELELLYEALSAKQSFDKAIRARGGDIISGADGFTPKTKFVKPRINRHHSIDVLPPGDIKGIGTTPKVPTFRRPQSEIDSGLNAGNQCHKRDTER